MTFLSFQSKFKNVKGGKNLKDHLIVGKLRSTGQVPPASLVYNYQAKNSSYILEWLKTMKIRIFYDI